MVFRLLPPSILGAVTITLSGIVLALPALVLAQARCTVSDVEVKLTRVRWIDECRTRPCIYLRGTGLLINRCNVSARAQVRIVGYDSKDVAIATRELWPFSTRNVPPGEHPFSIDQWLDHDPDIKRLTLQVVDVRQ